jgi:hypothetical protein
MAVSLTKCKKRSMMLSEIESIRSKQLGRAFKPKRLTGSGIEFPSNLIQFFLRERTQVAALGSPDYPQLFQ